MKRLIGICQKKYPEGVGIFLTAGAWYQMLVDPDEKTKDVDVIICRRDLEGYLVPIDGNALHDELKANSIKYEMSNMSRYGKDNSILPYVDVLSPYRMLISEQSTYRASVIPFGNVALCPFHPADWVAMHTPSDLHAGHRVRKIISVLGRPTEEEYLTAVEDIGNKGIVIHNRFMDSYGTSITSYESQDVVSLIRAQKERNGIAEDFGI
jgi:hypothetical protein